MTNTETARQVLLTLHERLFRDGDFAAVDDLLSDDFVWRQHGLPQEPEPGREGLFDFAYLLQIAVPDWTWTIEPPLGDGDRAVIRWTWSGEHTGPLWGRGPTHRQLLVTGIHIARVQDGQVRELWQNWGLMGLLQQVGYLPFIGEPLVAERSAP